ncbi:hypothetical protein EVAR_102308_1 [Eumeta japonica]|uniref:Uncharacterized protein n=1 Tax=Eumeta variegata TaxID=151549 RepID=A0A4C1WJ23_EUMVA|nr:hypothetical protein EVAR_102308_1 [Eumeta japonica]
MVPGKHLPDDTNVEALALFKEHNEKKRNSANVNNSRSILFNLSDAQKLNAQEASVEPVSPTAQHLAVIRPHLQADQEETTLLNAWPGCKRERGRRAAAPQDELEFCPALGLRDLPCKSDDRTRLGDAGHCRPRSHIAGGTRRDHQLLLRRWVQGPKGKSRRGKDTESISLRLKIYLSWSIIALDVLNSLVTPA